MASSMQYFSTFSLDLSSGLKMIVRKRAYNINYVGSRHFSVICSESIAFYLNILSNVFLYGTEDFLYFSNIISLVKMYYFQILWWFQILQYNEQNSRVYKKINSAEFLLFVFFFYFEMMRYELTVIQFHCNSIFYICCCVFLLFYFIFLFYEKNYN